MSGSESLFSHDDPRVGDRVRCCRFGEWRNGTIRKLLFLDAVALVEFDSAATVHVLVRNLRPAVDE